MADAGKTEETMHGGHGSAPPPDSAKAKKRRDTITIGLTMVGLVLAYLAYRASKRQAGGPVLNSTPLTMLPPGAGAAATQPGTGDAAQMSGGLQAIMNALGGLSSQLSTMEQGQPGSPGSGVQNGPSTPAAGQPKPAPVAWKPYSTAPAAVSAYTASPGTIGGTPINAQSIPTQGIGTYTITQGSGVTESYAGTLSQAQAEAAASGGKLQTVGTGTSAPMPGGGGY